MGSERRECPRTGKPWLQPSKRGRSPNVSSLNYGAETLPGLRAGAFPSRGVHRYHSGVAPPLRLMCSVVLAALFAAGCSQASPADEAFQLSDCARQTDNPHSVARIWDEALLDAIRRDFPAPTVHARNLFHTSAAMWDAWAAYDPTAVGYFVDEAQQADDTTYWFFEVYSGDEALKVHGKGELMRPAMKGLGAFLAGAPEITMLSPVVAKGIEI